MSNTPVDLPVNLNGEDDTGLPWGFLDEAGERPSTSRQRRLNRRARRAS